MPKVKFNETGVLTGTKEEGQIYYKLGQVRTVSDEALANLPASAYQIVEDNEVAPVAPVQPVNETTIPAQSALDDHRDTKEVKKVLEGEYKGDVDENGDVVGDEDEDDLDEDIEEKRLRKPASNKQVTKAKNK